MFDIGFWEIALISIMALVVIGPERLPKVARTMGQWFGKARRFVEGVKGEVESEFDTAELKRLLHNQEVQLKELQGKLSQETEDFRSGFSYNLEDENKADSSAAVDDQIEDHSDDQFEDDYLEFMDEDEEKDHEQIAAEKKQKEEQAKKRAKEQAAREAREFKNPAVDDATEAEQLTVAEEEKQQNRHDG